LTASLILHVAPQRGKFSISFAVKDEGRLWRKTGR
jgi:hypothetical protein